RGAALHAGVRTARTGSGGGLDADARAALGRVITINILSHSLGIEARHRDERVNDVLIAKNTQLPAATSRVYRTTLDGQQRVRVRVLQGEARQVEACISVGECWIDELPPNLPKDSPIQVRCGAAENGLVEVMALDMTSGRLARATIRRDSGLTEDEIAREADWLRGLRVL